MLGTKVGSAVVIVRRMTTRELVAAQPWPSREWSCDRLMIGLQSQ
ncbi:MAG: hypothetical protein ACI9W2_004045 [Gammaproteobacteria bacterium]|jgi:hypothetical protein